VINRQTSSAGVCSPIRLAAMCVFGRRDPITTTKPPTDATITSNQTRDMSLLHSSVPPAR